MSEELEALEVISNVDTPFVDMVTKEVFISDIKIKNAYDEEYEIVKSGLEQLEDYKQIEQELGIDLVTLFKALKGGIWFKHSSPFLEKENPIIFSIGWHLNYNDATNRYFLELGSSISLIVDQGDYLLEIVEFKDYGKTWALTEKELEK